MGSKTLQGTLHTTRAIVAQGLIPEAQPTAWGCELQIHVHEAVQRLRKASAKRNSCEYHALETMIRYQHNLKQGAGERPWTLTA